MTSETIEILGKKISLFRSSKDPIHNPTYRVEPIRGRSLRRQTRQLQLPGSPIRLLHTASGTGRISQQGELDRFRRINLQSLSQVLVIDRQGRIIANPHINELALRKDGEKLTVAQIVEDISDVEAHRIALAVGIDSDRLDPMDVSEMVGTLAFDYGETEAYIRLLLTPPAAKKIVGEAEVRYHKLIAKTIRDHSDVFIGTMSQDGPAAVKVHARLKKLASVESIRGRMEESPDFSRQMLSDAVAATMNKEKRYQDKIGRFLNIDQVAKVFFEKGFYAANHVYETDFADQEPSFDITALLGKISKALLNPFVQKRAKQLLATSGSKLEYATLKLLHSVIEMASPDVQAEIIRDLLETDAARRLKPQIQKWIR